MPRFRRRTEIQSPAGAGRALRSQEWLAARFRFIIDRYFPELSFREDVVVRFGRRCRRRLGSLRLKDGAPLITVNGLYRLPEVPEPVVDATIAHELAHLFHGCLERPAPGASGRPRLHRYPHRGGVVDQELAGRGLAGMSNEAKSWIEGYWWDLCHRELGRGRKQASVPAY